MRTDKKTLSDAFLRTLKASGHRYEVSDLSSIGLRARISSKGIAIFILKCRDAGGKQQTVTLGAYPSLTLKAARSNASQMRLALKSGQYLNAIKHARRVRVAPQPTLSVLISEFEEHRKQIRSVWRIKGPKSTRSEARRCIECVFHRLLSRDATSLSEQDFSSSMRSYKPIRQIKGKTSSNGQVSRARSYLMPVLNWASGRKNFIQTGAGRDPALSVIDLSNVFDPANNDPSITGERSRLLTEDELSALLPYLTYPAPKLPRLRLTAEKDFRPISLRFLLFTAARLDEMVTMKWKDVDFSNKVWRKPSVKSTQGSRRGQSLPLSLAVLDILKSLPKFSKANPDELIFPNAIGGKLGNWTRFQNSLMDASKTERWHRHDLRRTAATLMQELSIPVSTIDQILGHTDPLRRENISGAASHYLRAVSIMKNVANPQSFALDALATALESIEAGSIPKPS